MPVPRISGYEILEVLGQGAMGVVYKARMEGRKALVALKVLSPAVAREPALAERLLREARAASVIRHENIVQGIDVGECDGRPYFAMEYVEGESLSRILKERGTMPEKDALSIGEQIASALKAASRAGILHRDIKPSNILVTPEGKAKLADLGLVKDVGEPDDALSGGAPAPLPASAAAEGTLTRAGSVMGTPQYMAPEQIRGDREIDVRADIYALGSTLYRAVAGRNAYDAPMIPDVLEKVLAGRWPVLRAIQPGISEPFEALVERMMARRPEDRFRDPEALLAAVAQVRRGELPEIQPLAVEPPAPLSAPARSSAARPALRRAPRRRPISIESSPSRLGRAAAAAAGILALLLAAGYLLRDRIAGTTSGEEDAAGPGASVLPDPSGLPELVPEEDIRFGRAAILLQNLPEDLDGLRSLLAELEPLAADPAAPASVRDGVAGLRVRIREEEAEVVVAEAPAPPPEESPPVETPPVAEPNEPPPEEAAPPVEPSPKESPDGPDPPAKKKGGGVSKKEPGSKREPGSKKEPGGKNKAGKKEPPEGKGKGKQKRPEEEPPPPVPASPEEREARLVELVAGRDAFQKDWTDKWNKLQADPTSKGAMKRMRDLQKSYNDFMRKFNDEFNGLGGKQWLKQKAGGKEKEPRRRGGG